MTAADRPPDRFPWYPHYVADWRLSRAVRQMSYEQRGMYRELMDVAWGDGTVEPCLMDDDGWIAKELGVVASRWKKVGPAIRACWESRDGKLYSPRLSKAWEIQRAKYDIAKRAGEESARKRREANASTNGRTNPRSTPVARPFQHKGQRKPNHTDADTDRTNSSSGPQRVGGLTDAALAAAKAGRR